MRSCRSATPVLPGNRHQSIQLPRRGDTEESRRSGSKADDSCDSCDDEYDCASDPSSSDGNGSEAVDCSTDPEAPECEDSYWEIVANNPNCTQAALNAYNAALHNIAVWAAGNNPLTISPSDGLNAVLGMVGGYFSKIFGWSGVPCASNLVGHQLSRKAPHPDERACPGSLSVLGIQALQ
jgi:hypothetical protein